MHASTHPRPAVGTRSAVFRPPRALGVIVGGGFSAWAFVAAFLALSVSVGAPAEFKTFLGWAFGAAMLLLGLVFLNWTLSVGTLAYVLDDDTLTIRWGFRRVIIPIESIQRMVPGRTLDEPRIDGLNWWGCHVGSADVKRLGFTIFYSTHNAPEELLYVVTTDESYGLTVVDQAAFAEEVQGRAIIGATAGVHPQRSAASGVAAIPFWRDCVAITAVALSALAAAILCGYVYNEYPGLPNVIRLSFPDLGGVVRVGDKGELLHIAWLGAGVLVVNSILGIAFHARERAAGIWLIASGGMLQLVLLAAAISAFHRA
ncbi:MAG TPA: PH domain-containing protein [Tepidiformaceae bacterium]|nr:PH domain-containing protein [Tepidiformaceae bacterium]